MQRTLKDSFIFRANFITYGLGTMCPDHSLFTIEKKYNFFKILLTFCEIYDRILVEFIKPRRCFYEL